MRRKLDLAASIIVAPDLLFLDEPTTGLDPRSRSALWEIVRGIVVGGTTVLLTTQYLDEADKLADRIAVIDHGRVIAAGTRGELKNSAGSAGIRIRLLDPAHRARARALIADHQIVVHDEPDPAVISARVPAQQRAGAAGELAARALGRLTGAGIGVSDFALGQPSLDEVFLALTGSQATPAQPEQAQSAPAGTLAIR
jgi:ABC-2 type transport system ATP-binding protein